MDLERDVLFLEKICKMWEIGKCWEKGWVRSNLFHSIFVAIFTPHQEK